VYNITHGTYIDYVFLFGDCRTLYSDRMVENTKFPGGAFLIAWYEQMPAGYICLSENGTRTKILYACTVPQMRGKGVYTALFKYAVQQAKGDVKLSITSDHKAHGTVANLCKQMGFVLSDPFIIYRCSTASYPKWEIYMEERGNRMCAALERKGFSCIPFDQADERLLDELYHSVENSFGNTLNPKSFFDQPGRNMNRSMSFACVKNGELASYVLLSSPDSKSVIFEHLSTAKKYIGSGCALLPFAKAMERYKENNIKRAAYIMRDENEAANNFRKNAVDMLTLSSKRWESYLLCVAKDI
jgi:GNAT superfamily N-acetyltransferase